MTNVSPENNSKIVIEKATSQDLDWIIEELKSFSSHYGTEISVFGKEENARAVTLKMIQEHVFFTAKKADQPLGFIAGYLVSHPFNPDLVVLTESFWWVVEKHRGSKAGSLLLDAFIEHGKLYADWIYLTLEHSSKVQDSSIIKRGFRPLEKNFLLEVV